MVAFQISSMKQFMAQLLAGEAFDIFLLEEASIRSAATINIEGRLNKDFFQKEDFSPDQTSNYDFMPWGNIKGLCFHLIKGKRPPLSFKFVLYLKPDLAEKLLKRENCGVDVSLISALALTIKFDGAKTILTTGVAAKTFLLSKEPDRIWDKTFSSYLAQKGIAAEILS